MPPLALSTPDYAVVAAYVLAVAGMGVYFARRTGSRDEYFLASRSVPWFAVGLSLLATLLSSLTYVSEPGEVWRSGVTAYLGKLLAMTAEATLVWLFVIPLLMRFRFTSAYEYLGYRFGPAARWLGVGLFSCLVVTWMGFVVLAMARSVSTVTGVRLEGIIALVGGVGTLYTVFGGLRAVIWTEVLQVVLMVGGCLITIAYVALATGTGPAQWYAAVPPPTFASLDPRVRTTVATFGLTMFVWHLCTHLGNQMAVQRYFSTADLAGARRSFVTAIAAGLVVNGLLIVVGMALVYYFTAGGRAVPLGLDPSRKHDLDMIFPAFMATQLPPGLGGAVLTAVLAAAMSTIDSAINALSSVWSVERDRLTGRSADVAGSRTLVFAKGSALVIGVLITSAAYGLDLVTRGGNMIEMMPRTFNSFLVPLGGMFLVGFFLPFVGGRAAVAGAAAAFAVAVLLAWAKPLFGLAEDVSFTWVLPGALVGLVAVAAGLGLVDRPRPEQVAGLTWFTRHDAPKIPAHLVAPPADA